MNNCSMTGLTNSSELNFRKNKNNTNISNNTNILR